MGLDDLKKAAGELPAKAAYARAKAAAERVLEESLMSDEELEAKRAQDEALAKRKRQKTLALVVIGALIVLGVVGMVLAYWHWFLLAGLLGLAALYARHRWRTRSKGTPAPKTRVEATPKAKAAEPEKPALASREAHDREIEDELAALKARKK